MSIKREGQGSTDLDALISGADPVVATQTEKTKSDIAVSPQKKKSPVKKVRLGRKPRSSQGKMTKKANVLFTDREWDQLLDSAEGRPVGSFIRTKLKDSGIIS